MSELLSTRTNPILAKTNPGFHPRIGIVKDIDLSGSRLPWQIPMAVMTVGAIASAILLAWTPSIVGIIVGLALCFVHTQKLTWDQRYDLHEAVNAERLEQVEKGIALIQSDEPYFHSIEFSKASSRMRREMILPSHWNKERTIKVDGKLDQIEGSYVIKTGPRTAVLVEKTLVPEEETWYQNFQKASELA